MTPEEAQQLVITAIHGEASKYPGGEPEDGPCGLEELSCFQDHIHSFVCVDGEVAVVVGSPTRIAQLAVEALANVITEHYELEYLFNKQWDRMRDAVALWREENPNERELLSPDLGALLEWLMERGNKALET